MHELFHVQRLSVCLLVRLDVEHFLEVDPTKGFGTVQGAPAVQNVDLATSILRKQIFEAFEDRDGRLRIKPMGHDHMATDQEGCSSLYLDIASGSKNKLLVCILPLDLIRHGVESVDLRQRAWFEGIRKITFLGVSTYLSHGYHDVFLFKGVLSHLFCWISIEESKIQIAC